MKKFLRYYLVVLMALFCGTVIAQEVTLDFTTNDSWNLPVGSANKATASASFSNGSYSITLAAADGYYFNSDGYLMLGKAGSTLTFPAFSFDVEKIVITGRDAASGSTKQNIYVGDVAVSTETTGAKTANTYEIASDYQAAGNIYVLKVTSAHNTQITKIEIYKKGGGSTVTVTAPTISGTTPFTESTEVTISGTPDGGKTYYTTDGSDPTSSSTQYTAPFTLTETTTVKAISYDKDNNASSITSKTFTKEEENMANNIAEFIAIESGKNATLKLNNAVVLYAGTNDIIVKDATAGTDFYQTGLALNAGQVLNGTIKGVRADYNGLKEFKKTDATNLDNVTITDGTVTPKTSTVAAVATAEDLTELYKLEKVEVVANGSNYDIVDGESTIRLYDQFKLNFTKSPGKFNIEGVVGNYKGAKQFWPTKAPEAVGEVTIEKASDIDDFINQDKGKPYELILENAQVVYAWTSSNGNVQAFVRDGTGALCFDFRNDFKTAGANFTTDKMLNGSIIMSNTLYNGLPQASAIAETNTDKLTFTDGSAAEPKKISSADVSKKLNDLVLLENVTITKKEDGKYYIDDVQLYNQFKLEAFNDLSTFEGEGKNVKGIAIVYKKNAETDAIYEIYPIEITSEGGGGGGETPGESSIIKFAAGDSYGDGQVYTSGEFKLTQVDTDAKTAIDANDSYFGTAEEYQKFEGRLKSGGKSSSKNAMTLTIPSDGTLKVYVRTGSNSATDRTLVLTQNDTELYNKVVQEEDAVKVTIGENEKNVYPIISVAVKAGEVSVGYPIGSLNFYAFEFVAGTTGIQNVIKPAIENGIRYNLAGQRVDENYKGVVIMNGKKYVVK